MMMIWIRVLENWRWWMWLFFEDVVYFEDNDDMICWYILYGYNKREEDRMVFRNFFRVIGDGIIC